MVNNSDFFYQSVNVNFLVTNDALFDLKFEKFVLALVHISETFYILCILKALDTSLDLKTLL